MKLQDIFESNVTDMDRFKQQQAAKNQPGQSMQDIWSQLGIEPAEDELGELEASFKKAFDSFTGPREVIFRAGGMFKIASNAYQDAEDEEDFDGMDRAHDQMVEAIRLLGGDVSIYDDDDY